jgi:hypothetical protein
MQMVFVTKIFQMNTKGKKSFLESFKHQKKNENSRLQLQRPAATVDLSSWQSLKTTFSKFASKHLAFG